MITHLTISLQAILISFLALGSIFCAWLAYISWRQRPNSSATLFSALMVAVILYSVGYGLELSSTNLPALLWCIRLEYLGVANLPALWLSLALFYANQMEWLKPKRLWILWIIPILTIISVWTNPYHHLFYTANSVNLMGPFPTLQVERGPFYWLHMIYSFGAFFGVSGILLRRYLYPHALYRRQASLMLIACLVTILITALHLAGISPIPGLDIIPFSMILSAIIIGWGILNHRLIDLPPIARDVLFDYQMDGVLVLDNHGLLVDFNPAAGKIFHLPSDAVGKPLHNYLSAEINQVFNSLQRTHVGLDFSIQSLEPQYFEISCVPLSRPNQGFIGDVIMFHETTQSKEAQIALERMNAELEDSLKQQRLTEQAYRSSQDHYRLLAENSNDVIWTMDMRGSFTYVSPAVERLRGFTPSEVLNQTLDELICPGSQRVISSAILGMTEAAKTRTIIKPEYYEIEQPCKGGGTVWTEVSVRLVFNESEEPVGFVGVSRDIRERKRAEQQLLHDATHDSLTGLPNRVLFIDRLGQAIEYTRQTDDLTFSVLFLDMDEFKIINDSLGHSFGDQLLYAIGERLKYCLRSYDTVARLGGDEFVFLLNDTKEIETTKTIARRIQDVLKPPFNLDGRQLFITASIGIVQSLVGYERSEDVLRDADIAMYRAKGLGKACFEFFEPNLRNKAIFRLEIENELRQALEKEKFELHYQPIFSLTTQQIIGFEALLRLHNRKQGYFSPAEFIPIAEASGLITIIGKWVLQEACSQMKGWQNTFPQMPPLNISVNISGKQFTQPDFIDQIEEVLRTTGLNPNCLILELTETVFIDNASKAGAVCSRLVELGVQLQIDDFGTGYSSLRYIKHFPIHTIKIDQSFIKEISVSSKNSDLVLAIILMAHSLGMEAIAEGIETQDQLQKLMGFGCKYGQGFLLARPLERKSIQKLLSENAENVYPPLMRMDEIKQPG